MNKLPTRCALAVVLSATLTAAGCSTTHSVATVDAGCTALGPLTYSTRDTDPTVRGIIGNNAAWGELCPDGADVR